jgi:hypothetical protein
MQVRLSENYVDLSPEAERARLWKLAQRIADEGLRPGESVPQFVMTMVDRVRYGDQIARAA